MRRDHSKTVKQQVISEKVVKLAKAIMHADANKQHLTIQVTRRTGVREAYYLARNLN